MTSLKINGISYDMADGFIYNDKYTEELDSGTITIPFSDKLNLSPFDFVEISDDRFGTKYFVIDTWVEETISFNPLKYNYTINLVSETIKLQKIVLPNITITHPIGKEPKSIGQKLSEYWRVYIYPQYPELIIDDMYGDFDNISCPEGEYNRPTMFEVFNTILGKVNAVVKVENHMIKYIKLDQYGKSINENKLYYNNDTQTIKDYANRLDIQVSNGISDKNSYSSLSGISVRASEGNAVINDDNMVIMLEKPIYDFVDEFESVMVYFPYYDIINNVEEHKIIGIDISDYIVEKAVYDTYKVSNSTSVLGKGYKRGSLYYTRGQNTIEGLSFNESSFFGINLDIALINIIKHYLKTYISNTANIDFAESQVRDNVLFKIYYKSQENYRFIVEKENDYNSTLIDNQTETQIDAYAFGKVEQDKLNRLGNKSQIITATYSHDEIIPELGDYIGRYVLAEREIVYYKDYALFKGYLYKDYVRKNMYYGLNSRKRSTQISTESVVRNDVVNYDVTFELENTGLTEIARYLLQPISASMIPDEEMGGFIGRDYREVINLCGVQTLKSSGESIQGENFLFLTPSVLTSSKSNILNFKFMDNYTAGIQTGEQITGGQKQNYIKYTDDYGEISNIIFLFYAKAPYQFVENVQTQQELNQYKNIADKLPLVNLNEARTILGNSINVLSGSKLLYKDSRETISITANLNYKDSENVIIGDFARYTSLGHRYNVANDYFDIYYSTTEEYEKGDEFALGQKTNDVYIDYEPVRDYLVYGNLFNYIQLRMNNQSLNINQWKSWALVERDTGRLIFGVNKGKLTNIPTKLYLNIEEKPY